VRGLRDQCVAAGVPFFFKQHGEWLTFYDRDNDDPDWQNIPEEKLGICRLNLAGGSGFHGDRVVYLRRVGKKAAGRLLDGQEWSQFPEVNGQ
jgi:protein gp37